jgi:hypothetical protein
MNHQIDHYSSGICFIRDKYSLSKYIEYATQYIRNSPKDYGGNFCEMICLYHYKNMNNDDIQVIPILYGNDVQYNVFPETYQHFNDYHSIFDGAAYGVYLLGQDGYHNNGEIVKGKTIDRYLVHAGRYKYTWDIVDGYKKPFIYDEKSQKWILINNLHAHAKNLEEGLSKPMEINIII